MAAFGASVHGDSCTLFKMIMPCYSIIYKQYTNKYSSKVSKAYVHIENNVLGKSDIVF